ncbi:MAG: zinc ABC transporter substrate-binding protein [Planctomycetes bacterium]|nr:zinc ABC transporter substrate-binding protein [Planctomycetota bacterium]
MIADLVKRVGGDRVTVETLMGPGVDPHRYLPSLDDRKKIEAAHLVFFNGLHLEGKMTDTFEKSRGRVRGHAVTDAIDRSLLRHADVDGGEHDPHVWFDVALWSRCVAPVKDALVALDPAGKDTYEKNAADHLKELDALDKEVRAELATVPPAKRKLVTSHDAFGYFGRAYGFEVRGLQGVSTASESGTKDVKELVDYLGANKIPAVFTETSVPDAGLKTVLDTCLRDHQHAVKLIGGADALYSDALGEPGTPGATYVGMIRHNVSVIVNALR